MKFRVKSIIAYMIIACMLMTFMPVLVSAANTENFMYTDFGADRDLDVTLLNTGKFAVCINVETNAEALSGYVYVEEAEGVKSVYAVGYDGVMPDNDAAATADFDLAKKASIKFTYDSEEIVMPIDSARAKNGTLYVNLNVNDFNTATGQSLSDSEFRALIATPELFSNFKLTANVVANLGYFPEGSVFISAKNITSDATAQGTGHYAIYQKTVAYSYPFAVKTAGQYDTYCLIYDSSTDTTNRGVNVYVNDTLCNSIDNQELAPSSAAFYWETAGIVTLSTDVNVLNVPANVQRFGGIILVPTSAGFSMTSDESVAMGNASTGVVDSTTVTRLSDLNALTTSNPYETTTVNVKVDGNDVVAKAGTAFMAGVLTKISNADGSFISAPTVADAIVAAGLTLTGSNGKNNAFKVGGKTVYPDRTLVYEGMEITVIDSADVTKADFTPVFRDQLATSSSSPTESNQQNGAGLRMLYPDNQAILNYFPFLSSISVDTATTTDSANNLINCQLNGYLTVEQGAVNWYATNKSISFPTGTKVYFLGDKIINVYSRYLDTGAGATAANNNSAANYVALGNSYLHAPFHFYYQKANTTDNWYDSSEWFIANTSAVNEITAVNRIADGKYQLLTTGTVPCQIMIMDADGAVKSVLKDQIVTGVAPLTITLEEGEKAYVWGSAPYNGEVTTAGIYQMKPLCDVLTY